MKSPTMMKLESSMDELVKPELSVGWVDPRVGLGPVWNGRFAKTAVVYITTCNFALGSNLWWWCALAYLFTPGRLLFVVWGLGWVWDSGWMKWTHGQWVKHLGQWSRKVGVTAFYRQSLSDDLPITTNDSNSLCSLTSTGVTSTCSTRDLRLAAL